MGFLNNFNNNPKELLKQSCKNGVLAGVKYALENGANVNSLKYIKHYDDE